MEYTPLCSEVDHHQLPLGGRQLWAVRAHSQTSLPSQNLGLCLLHRLGAASQFLLIFITSKLCVGMTGIFYIIWYVY